MKLTQIAAVPKGNEMIVIPFHHWYRNCFGMIPIRVDDDGFILVSPWCYDPSHYPPGSCIQ
ncbi:hypothetical protein EN875_034075 [Mesorhizobium sp. M2D.F.Ca.ET.232.01.1.1]|uniref:hypothetical protein n=1 Tax=Mesorhizobium sp. M2D.F.Ca.ET.232.01.1.1 TaxID=2496670 RepID=UPI000FCB24BA|nr:hypothetical protein [Mesorhizobium sp. M2D.F.Ca.ET.232.01.1.1]TGP27370.1 hypothetical protein EN875_034075 [Mesorhizobium sp. M2D.F.Ca.ET.232.01.1.1]